MINGILYRDMVISAANAIDNCKDMVNSLNVFPVPDGDTGLNMSLTMQAGKAAISGFEGSLSDCAEKVAAALLRGGRGNSGVILSLFFRGVSKELKGKESADNMMFARAFRAGVDAAYKAVRNPTEGTVLTVMRVSAERAFSAASSSPELSLEDFFGVIEDAARDTLEKTPDMLPVLKQANVVDAGGKGFLIILGGMKSVADGRGIVESTASDQVQDKADFSSFNTEDIKYAYCTECIVDKDPSGRVTPSKVEKFRDFIMGCGDSGVFIDDDTFIKFHIHTNDPGKVLTECLRYGTLAKVKVENMKAQHTSLAEVSGAADSAKPAVAEPVKDYGFVSVAAGDGICAVFSELGADNIVQGGQTMNPSTDDIINAVNATPSRIVFVLPNNKNIYMAAKQAEELVKDKRVVVLRTVSVPQGISAMLAFNPEVSVDENKAAMKEAMEHVSTYKMTFAARNSTFGDKQIKEGQILGLSGSEVTCVSDSKAECMKELASSMKDSSYITVFYGCDVSEQEAEAMGEIIRDEVGSAADVTVINGGQPVYYYLISAE